MDNKYESYNAALYHQFQYVQYSGKSSYPTHVEMNILK